MKLYYTAPNNVGQVGSPWGPIPNQAVYSKTVNPTQLEVVAAMLERQAKLAANHNDLIVWWLDHEELDARLYGVDPTGATDSLAALQAVTRAAQRTGADILLPHRGILQLSEQWVIGKKFIDEDECSFDGGYSTLEDCDSFNETDYNAAKALPLVGIKGRGCSLWGNFTAASEKAILNYSRPGSGNTTHNPNLANISDLCLIGKDGYSIADGLEDDTANTVDTNLSGIFAPNAIVRLQNISVRDLKRGIVPVAAFWSRLEHIFAWHCERGIDFIHANIVLGTGLSAWYCDVAFGASGQRIKLQQVSTEQCKKSLQVPTCDGFQVDQAYFEVVGADFTDYQLEIGSAGGAYYVQLNDVHLSTSHGKTAILDHAQVLAQNTRLYDHGVEDDRVLLEDNACTLKALASSLPINPDSYSNNPSPQKVDWTVNGIAWTYNASDCEDIAHGRSVARSFSVTCEAQDIVVPQLSVPAGWEQAAQVTASNTVRLTLTNVSGSASDLPTMTGFIHVKSNRVLA